MPACLANASCCEIGIAALFVCCLFGALIVHATALRFVGFGSMPGVGGQNSSSLRRAWVLTKLRVGLIEPYRLPKSLLRIDRCLGPYFARSASPQCMSSIVLGVQLVLWVSVGIRECSYALAHDRCVKAAAD